MRDVFLNKGHLLLLCALFILSCASYQEKVSSARNLLVSGQYQQSAQAFEEQIETNSGDKLAYLLEYATALHLAGLYKESNAAFESADVMCDLNDYTSVSREAGAMLVKEGTVQYKAETFEFLLINIYQALNYLLLNDLENAQVKARKLNEKLNRVELGKETKQQQASFAAYLAGLLWESQGDWDNAHILYKKAYELDPSRELFQKAVLVSAKMARREEAFVKYKKIWPDLQKQVDWKSIKDDGEFVFIFQQGWVPRKRLQPGNRKLPEMVSVAANVRGVILEVSGQNYKSEVVYDLDAIAKKTLSDDMARLAARALARQASRIAVRESARHNNKNSALGAVAIASVIFDVMDVADLRQWSTLPASFQMIRVPMVPGKYSVRVLSNDTQFVVWSGDIKIEKGKKIIQTARGF